MRDASFSPSRSITGMSGSDDKADVDALSTRLRQTISKRAQKRAQIIGAAVRAAHMLSIGMPGVIDETQLSHDGVSLVLDAAQELCGARR